MRPELYIWYFVLLLCSHPMDSFITLIVDLLLLPYYLSMEGICECSSYLVMLDWFGYLYLSFIQWFVDLVNLSKLTGHMLVVRERIHQVGSDLNIKNLCFEQTVTLEELWWRYYITLFLWICRPLQHIRWRPQSWGYRCYTFRMLFCLWKLFVSFILLWFLSKSAIHFLHLELKQCSFFSKWTKFVCATLCSNCALHVKQFCWLLMTWHGSPTISLLMVLEMQGLCGIRRLGVQGDSGLFHFVVSRSIFVLKS